MQTNGPAAGWSWLKRGLNIGFEHPRVLFGAGALLLGYAVVVVILQEGLEYLFDLSPHAQLALTGVLMVVGAVIHPVLGAGFLRLMAAVEHGRPVGALSLLDAFRRDQGVSRVVVTGLCLTAIYVLFLALLWLTVAPDLGSWYMQIMALGPHPARDALPALPHGTGTAVAIAIVFFIFYSAAYAIAMGQAAMRAQAPMEALRDGVVGAFKNVLPLLVLALTSMVGLVVFAVALGIALLIVGALLSLISKALAMVLIIAVYLGIVLLAYVVIFGVMYAMWRDVAGDEPGDPSESMAISVEA